MNHVIEITTTLFKFTLPLRLTWHPKVTVLDERPLEPAVPPLIFKTFGFFAISTYNS
jgi:hypothetical protein